MLVCQVLSDDGAAALYQKALATEESSSTRRLGYSQSWSHQMVTEAQRNVFQNTQHHFPS